MNNCFSLFRMQQRSSPKGSSRRGARGFRSGRNFRSDANPIREFLGSPFSRAVLFLLCLALLLTGTASCSGNTESSTKTESDSATSETESASESETEEPLNYHFVSNISAYLPYLNPEGGMLVLANKQSVLGETYDPGVLVTLDTSLCLYGKDIQMEQTAAMALSAMLIEMHALGITDVYATSGYRSYARQQYLFNYYCQEEAKAHPNWTEEKVKAYVLTYSAYPGTSEHQTGLCADLMTTAMSGLYNYGYEYGGRVGFAETAAYAWLKDNAYKFGFILRYPEDKTDVTGYAYESWHYRFVGQRVARDIYNGRLTLEEYLQGRG